MLIMLSKRHNGPVANAMQGLLSQD